MSSPVFLRRVVLNNYKSIKECSVELGPLTFLVGQNGAGKSNFLDALRLVTDSLNNPLEHALRERGGINEVRRRSSGHPTHFGIRIDWELPCGGGVYAFRVGALEKGGFKIQREECRVFGGGLSNEHFYAVEDGEVKKSSFPVVPLASSDRLYLVAAAGLPPFRPLYDALCHMGFYNLNPDAIRKLQPPDPGEVLKRDGSNLASVLSVMAKESAGAHSRVVDFLSHVSPGIQAIEVKHVGGKMETLEFRQMVGTNELPWRFMAENMSDGTLRALGVLTALFQSANGGKRKVPFVGIEEPEVAVHPGAAGVIRDGLRVASKTTQVVVTSHSPDLLDDKDIRDTNILAVANKKGETIIAPPNKAERESIKEGLYTAGELLRMNSIEPDADAVANISGRQLDLFAEHET